MSIPKNSPVQIPSSLWSSSKLDWESSLKLSSLIKLRITLAINEKPIRPAVRCGQYGLHFLFLNAVPIRYRETQSIKILIVIFI